MIINITNSYTQAYIIGGLQPRTAYSVSILAYTAAGNGPRSIHLTVLTRTRKIQTYTIMSVLLVNDIGMATVCLVKSIAMPNCTHLFNITIGNGPLITGFGINGNNLAIATRSYLSSWIAVHCTTPDTSPNTTVEWFFANGTRIGPAYRGSNIGVYKFGNGTTVLDLGIIRGLTYCEGGRYTCVVNTTTGRSERRLFHLYVGSESKAQS